MFGGGWRQAGLLAAGCLYALDHHVERLEEDHERARYIAKELNSLDAFSVDLDTVQTNMVYVECKRPAAEVAATLAASGIDVFDISPTHVRIVIHLHITDDDVQRLIDVCTSEF